MAEFRIFPDIRLICGDIPQNVQRNVLEISFCIKGVCEYRTDTGYCYLTRDNYIALKHFAGDNYHVTGSLNCCLVSLLVDMNNSNTVSSLIGMSDGFPYIIENEVRICQDEEITEAFSELYRECMNKQTSALKIKVLELLILLNEQKTIIHRKNEKIREAGRFICKHISDHYTISQLSEMYGIDATTFKSLFRKIHGCPIYNYTKNRKIFRAAELLRNTDMKIIDIAEEVGYSNASKFSCAFREVMGVNPKYFQMEHKSSLSITDNDALRRIAY